MQNTLTDTSDVVGQIKQILVEGLQVNIKVDEIPDDYSLLEDGLALDSILIAELIALIESRFGLRFDDRDLEVEMFENLGVLAAFVSRARDAARARATESEAGQSAC
jgi:acyl carrier protein